jgi:poly(3-hydroxybutyrate) depolymerase
MILLFTASSATGAPDTRMVLDGGRGSWQDTCMPVTDTHREGTVIAGQCCDASDSSINGCRRYVGSNDDAGCLAGMPPRPMDYVDTEEMCAAAGLSVCSNSCAGRGCAYNAHPVWSSNLCPGPSTSPTVQPTHSPTGYPTAAPTANLACNVLCSLWGAAQTCQFWMDAGVTCATLAAFPGACADDCTATCCLADPPLPPPPPPPPPPSSPPPGPPVTTTPTGAPSTAGPTELPSAAPTTAPSETSNEIVDARVSQTSDARRLLTWRFAEGASTPAVFDGDRTTFIGGGRSSQNQKIVAIRLRRPCLAASIAVYGLDDTRSCRQSANVGTAACGLRGIRAAHAMFPYGDWRCFAQSDMVAAFATPATGSCSRGGADAPSGTVFNFFVEAKYFSFAFWGATGVQEIELVSCSEPAPPTTAPTVRAWAGWGTSSRMVLVLDGGSGRFPNATCVDPAVTEAHGERLATQCCIRPPDPQANGEPSKDDPAYSDEASRCRRYLGTDDTTCVAGVPPRPMLYAQAASLCESHGLVVCDINCAGRGCGYDDYPVWTASFDACAAVPRPPNPPPPPPGPVTLRLTGSNARPTEICAPGGRCFDILVPRQAQPRTQPLVIDLHDASSDKAEQALVSGWAELASRHNFVVVWPNALTAPLLTFLAEAQAHAQVRAWNDGAGLWQLIARLQGADAVPDDVAFLLRVIEMAAGAVPSVNTRRVYVTGLGDGCNMAQHVAFHASGRLAAVGCFSGVLHRPVGSITPAELQAYSPLPVSLTFSEERPVNGARESFEAWASLNQCTGASQTLRELAGVSRDRYGACRGGLEVSFTSLAAPSGAALGSEFRIGEEVDLHRAIYSATGPTSIPRPSSNRPTPLCLSTLHLTPLTVACRGQLTRTTTLWREAGSL